MRDYGCGSWMSAMVDVRHRFPGVTEGVHRTWARFDGPAGTQVVDSAIQATSAWQRSGNNANSHGSFAAADACDALIADTQRIMGEFLCADPSGFIFGPSTTSNVFSITRAIGRDLHAGDEIICTRLDHDSNVSPWLQVAEYSGATVKFAEFDTTTGRLETSAVEDQLSGRTTWVAVTGASNGIGTMPDITAITASAHAAGAKVVVDGVHLTPHAPVDLSAIGCDVYSTSAYKWYGPHAGITWVRPELLDELKAYKVRPAPATGPGKFMLGTPAYENIASLGAAAEFLTGIGMQNVRAHERAVFGRLLDGLLADDRITVLGPHDLDSRAPTVAFNVAGTPPDEVARRLAAEQIAVWDGNYYAVELMERYGLPGGAVRAGIALYVTDDDVDRLLLAVNGL
jgi:cysteine desulfurase family protein (TIGR01976 family)